jgi:hypothetical protein
MLSNSNASPTTAEDFTSPLSTSFHTSSLTHNTQSSRSASLKRRELASSARPLRHGHRLIARRRALKLLASLLDARRARRAIDRRSVAEAGVDADEQLAVGRLDILDDDVALGTLLAVAAGAV